MKKKMLLIPLALLLAISLVAIGCAKPAPAPAPVPAPAPAPTPTAKPIKWGTTQPLTGYDYEEALEVAGGVRMALDEVGWKVAGRDVELIIEDDAWDPAIAVSKTKKLILSDEVDMLVGVYHSLGVLGCKDLIIEKNILALSGWGLCPPLFKDEYFKNHFNTGYEQGEQMARFMGAAAYDLGYRKAIIMENDFEAGRDNAARFKSIFEGLGGEVVQEIYTPMGCLDFSSYFLTADIEHADVIYCFYWGGSAVAWFCQYIDAGLKERIPFWTWGVLDDDTLDSIEKAGYGEEAVGIKHGLFYARALDIPSNNAWRDRMRQMYGKCYADFGFVNGYDAGVLAIKAIEAVNGDTSDLDGMVKYLEEMEYLSPRGPVSYGPKHVLTQPGYILQVVKENGEIFNKAVKTYPGMSMEWTPKS